MNTDEPRILLVISGPTAVGKTSLSIDLAQELATEIVSADSRQFYRELKIGTAAPSEEDLARVPHHFIGHLSIHDPYNVSRFESDALARLQELFQYHKTVIMTGGSGLYINAVCQGIDELPDPDPALRESLKELLQDKGIAALQEKLKQLDPDYYARVDLNNPSRLLRALEVCITTGLPFSSFRSNVHRIRPFSIIKTGLFRDKEELNSRIDHRVGQMMNQGLLREAESLYPYRHLNALNTVGYKELFRYMDGAMSLSQAVEKIKTNTRSFAKRQMTWFNKDKDIRWVQADQIKKLSNEEIKKLRN